MQQEQKELERGWFDFFQKPPVHLFGAIQQEHIFKSLAMDPGVKPVQLLQTDVNTPVNNNVRVEALGERDNRAAATEIRRIIAENLDVSQNGAAVDVEYLLSPNGSRDQKESAAARLNELNFGMDSRMVTIASSPEVLEPLVRLLYLHTSPQAQRFAGRVLMALTIQRDKNIVTVFPGALAGVMHLLYVNTDLVAPYFATLVLKAHIEKEGNRFTIAEFPGALQGLVGLLRWTGRMPLQMQSACAAVRMLINLSRRQNESRLYITMCPGALQGLVELLQEGPDCVKRSAVEALGNLLAPETSAIILGFEGVQQGLVDLLFRNDNSTLQTVAAKTLGDIAAASELGHFIAIFPRALEGLAALLHKHWSPDGQQQAARTISYLAESDSADSGVVAATLPRILPSMVRLLAEDEYPATQEHALRAFTYLSRLSENKTMILQHPFAVRDIGRLWSTGHSPGIREQAGKALANLHSQFKGFATEVPRNPRLALTGVVNDIGTGEHSTEKHMGEEHGLSDKSN